MGKPIKILDIIKKMFEVYAKDDQKLKIKISGNKFNEKLSERLFYKNKIYKTNIKKVFTIQDELLNKKKFMADLDKIILNINLSNEVNLKNQLNKLLRIK